MPFMRRSLILICLCIISIRLASAADPAQTPGSISRYHSDNLSGALGKPLPAALQVQVLSREVSTWLGGKRRHPIEGVEIRFTLSASAIRRGAILDATSVKTDAGGIARAHLTFGDEPGVYQVMAQAVTENGEVLDPVRFEVLGGVIVRGGGQDARAGNAAPDPLTVKVESAPGRPLEGVEVEVNIVQAVGKSRVVPETAITGADGMVRFMVTPGSKNGAMKAEIRMRRLVPGEHDDDWREIGQTSARFFSFAPFSLFIQVLGGLAIFIFGMNHLSNALTMIAGDRLRQWLNFLTRNRVMGVLAGTVVTGLIQSSSATSVMVIGFVNAGLFELRQAISVIFGANIGTTVTAQMISFKLDHLALPAVAIGVLITLLARRERSRDWAAALIGFGLLFLGLTMMSGPLKGLKDSSFMVDLFASLTCAPVDGHIVWSAPLKGILVGMVVTVAVQSSSAAIGLMLALVGTGILDVWAAFSILLGSNIGTTITAVLASIGANRTCKRTALAHAMFNLVGVVIMYLLLFVQWGGLPCFMHLVDKVTPGNAFVGENVERFAANAHTIFNILAALIFMPLIGIFVKICEAAIPKADEEDEGKTIRYLEPHLLGTPSVAIAQVFRELGYMSRQGRRALSIAAETVGGASEAQFEKQYERIYRRDARLTRLQDEVLGYIEQISQRNLSERQSRLIPRLVQSVNDTERIGDACVGLLKLQRRLYKRKITFMTTAQNELSDLFKAVDEMYERVMDGLENGDPKAADRIASLRKRIVMMRKDMRKNHLTRMETGEGDVRAGTVFIEMLSQLEEISRLLANMMTSAAEAVGMLNGAPPKSSDRDEDFGGENDFADEDEMVST